MRLKTRKAMLLTLVGAMALIAALMASSVIAAPGGEKGPPDVVPLGKAIDKDGKEVQGYAFIPDFPDTLELRLAFP